MKEGIKYLMPKRKAPSRRGRQPTVRAKELAGPVSRKAAQQALEEGGQEAIRYQTEVIVNYSHSNKKQMSIKYNILLS